jgi:DNA-binding transcriptional ArsR family regulator
MSCALKVLVDPARRSILQSLRGGALGLETLDGLRVAERTALAEHLRALRRAGLLREQRDERGSGVRYALAQERVHELAVFLRAVVREV